MSPANFDLEKKLSILNRIDDDEIIKELVAQGTKFESKKFSISFDAQF